MTYHRKASTHLMPMAETQSRTIAIELSTMRSGSTLLKALMSAAPDISSLPEVNFAKFQSHDAQQRIEALCPERIRSASICGLAFP